MARPFALRIPRRVPAHVRGILWMLLSVTAFTGVLIIGRHVTQDMHPFEALFLRSIFMIAFMLPWLARRGLGAMRTGRIGAYALRGVLAATNMTLLFFAVSLIPVADLTAIVFIRPMFVAVLAMLILGEMVGPRAWIAILVGFAGAMVVVRPGFAEVNAGALLALASAATAALTFVLVKNLTRTEAPDVIAFYQPVFVLPIAGIATLFVWTAPTEWDLFWCAGLGFLAVVTHRAMNRAFAATDLTLLQPLDFLRLPIAALLGFLAFGEVPDLFVWVGGAVIFAASIYGSRRRAS